MKHAFTFWDLRKLFFETSEINLDQFQSSVSRGYLTEEARLREMESVGGRLVDSVVLSCTREREWPSIAPIVRFVADSPGAD
jgi:hypothetical protein